MLRRNNYFLNLLSNWTFCLFEEFCRIWTEHCIVFILLRDPGGSVKSLNFLKQMFINCQTLTLFELVMPFFTLFIFTVKYQWGVSHFQKTHVVSFVFMTKTWQNPHFWGISFDLWSALCETEFPFPSNIQLTHCLQDFPYFLTTDNPPLFIFSLVIGTWPLLLWCVSIALNTFTQMKPKHENWPRVENEPATISENRKNRCNFYLNACYSSAVLPEKDNAMFQRILAAEPILPGPIWKFPGKFPGYFISLK